MLASGRPAKWRQTKPGVSSLETHPCAFCMVHRKGPASLWGVTFITKLKMNLSPNSYLIVELNSPSVNRF